MYQTIRNFPTQFLESLKIVDKLDLSNFASGPFKHFYYAAMGGSSLPADLVNEHLGGKVQFHCIRDYLLPSHAGPEDLVFCASFSGNTEETLSAYEDAKKRNCQVIAFSNGGELEKLALQDGIPFAKIPDCIQPRCATGNFFATSMGILARIGVIPDPRKEIASLVDFLEPQQDSFEKQGKAIAAQLKDKVPIIYGPTELYSVCRIWKIKLNENSKIQSFFNVLPELNHNEMVGFTHLVMKPSLVFLKNSSMHPRNRRRIEVMKNILGNQISMIEIELTGDSLLQEMFAALAIGDYASYHLALTYEMDPAPVEMVEDFKKLLGS